MFPNIFRRIQKSNQNKYGESEKEITTKIIPKSEPVSTSASKSEPVPTSTPKSVSTPISKWILKDDEWDEELIEIDVEKEIKDKEIKESETKTNEDEWNKGLEWINEEIKKSRNLKK